MFRKLAIILLSICILSFNANASSDGKLSLSHKEEKDINDCTTHGKSMIAAHEAEVAKKETDKAAATTKLKALGLTDDEIAALYG